MGLSYPIVRDKEDQSPQTTIDLIVELREGLSSKGRDHRPQTIAWHLAHHHEMVVSVNSIHTPPSNYKFRAAVQADQVGEGDIPHLSKDWLLKYATDMKHFGWL